MKSSSSIVIAPSDTGGRQSSLSSRSSLSLPHSTQKQLLVHVFPFHGNGISRSAPFQHLFPDGDRELKELLGAAKAAQGRAEVGGSLSSQFAAVTYGYFVPQGKGAASFPGRLFFLVGHPCFSRVDSCRTLSVLTGRTPSEGRRARRLARGPPGGRRVAVLVWAVCPCGWKFYSSPQPPGDLHEDSSLLEPLCLARGEASR